MQGLQMIGSFLIQALDLARHTRLNLEIIDKLEIMKELGYPVLLGTSRNQ